MLKIGPIGKGYVKELTTNKGTRYIARWNAFVVKDGVRTRILCGSHELGPKSNTGLKSLKQAKDAWDAIRSTVFVKQHQPVQFLPKTEVSAQVTLKTPLFRGSATMKVRDFITLVYEPRRRNGLQDNSLANWAYYRDSILNPFFGNYTINEMNDEELVKDFMQKIADAGYRHETAKKSYTYVKALLDTARDLGLTIGNASRLIPIAMRVPKRIKRATSQPAIDIDQFISLLDEMPSERDAVILSILFYCAVRRSEWSAIKPKDIVTKNGGIVYLVLDRSFCSLKHRVKEWEGEQGLNEGNVRQEVVLPPELADRLIALSPEVADQDKFIFATRNGNPLIPTNWADDVLKPAGERAGIPNVSFHWFRRGHATDQHHVGKIGDKAIQDQLRHSKASTTRDVYMQKSSPETARAVASLEGRVLEKLASRGGAK